MTYHLEPGQTAPTQVVESGRIVFEGTYTACARFVAEKTGEQMHISDQVAECLLNDGWQMITSNVYQCLVKGFAESGTVSNGDRVVNLTFDMIGRYLSRVDGWGHVEKDVDLRDFANNPEGAIKAVMR